MQNLTNTQLINYYRRFQMNAYNPKLMWTTPYIEHTHDKFKTEFARRRKADPRTVYFATI